MDVTFLPPILAFVCGGWCIGGLIVGGIALAGAAYAAGRAHQKKVDREQESDETGITPDGE